MAESNIPHRDSPSRGFFSWRDDVGRLNATQTNHAERISNIEGTMMRTGDFANLKRMIRLIEVRVEGMVEVMDSHSRLLHQLSPDGVAGDAHSGGEEEEKQARTSRATLCLMKTSPSKPSRLSSPNGALSTRGRRMMRMPLMTPMPPMTSASPLTS